MAASLSAFLSQNAKRPDIHKFVVSDRFTDENGKPVEWEYGCISGKENADISNRYAENRSGYTAALAVACTRFPDLQNADLQDSYGVKSAEELIQVMLVSGEYNNYVSKIFEANKFKVTPELVDEAKN